MKGNTYVPTCRKFMNKQLSSRININNTTMSHKLESELCLKKDFKNRFKVNN
jgi:hypothetical protein